LRQLSLGDTEGATGWLQAESTQRKATICPEGNAL
jgi:hypothetical protein